MRDDNECETIVIRTRANMKQREHHGASTECAFLMELVRFDGERFEFAVADIDRCQQLIKDLKPEHLTVACGDGEDGCVTRHLLLGRASDVTVH